MWSGTWVPENAVSIQLLLKSWLQRIFLECMDDAEKEFFQEKKNYDIVRRKIAERFLVEICRGTEFINSGVYSVGGLPN